MSPKLPVVTAANMIRALKRAGFIVHHQEGSHVAMKRLEQKGGPYVIVPNHSGDLKEGTVRSILRQAHMSADELRLWL